MFRGSRDQLLFQAFIAFLIFVDWAIVARLTIIASAVTFFFSPQPLLRLGAVGACIVVLFLNRLKQKYELEKIVAEENAAAAAAAGGGDSAAATATTVGGEAAVDSSAVRSAGVAATGSGEEDKKRD
eukprot:GDKI01013940.1.p1 GENE.GDKI01013940.1~~GDKI01013940.1.p1  ORF type:complete len:127 (+),score=31.88 GDKI01013940.1:127-507(+)